MKSVVRKPQQAKAPEAAAADPAVGPLMTFEEAKAGALVTAFGLVRVKDGISFVRLQVRGAEVVEAIFSEPDGKIPQFDQFKKAAAIRFVQNDPPEARHPPKEPS